jgi:hypothetical protein
VVLDGAATLSTTPLEDEGNPVARALLAPNCQSVCRHVGMVAEFLFASCVCICGRPSCDIKTLIARRSRDPMSCLISSRLLWGGDLWPAAHASSRRDGFAFVVSVVWFMTAGLVVSHLLRWYLGLSSGLLCPADHRVCLSVGCP